MTDIPDPDCLAKVPRHVAIIMDGNGRWGSKKGIGRLEGHRRGVENVRTLVELCCELNISYLTLFAFSSENWRRPKAEVQWLMNLLSNALDKEVKKLHANGIRLKFIGNTDGVMDSIQSKINDATTLTKSNTRLHLTIAINYGGKWDMVEACRSLAQQVKIACIEPGDITQQTISQSLSTRDLPDPDLFIRTGGEKRISNFMLWQLAYTELYFTDTHWPAFDRDEFLKALDSYASRTRRFGAVAAESTD